MVKSGKWLGLKAALATSVSSAVLASAPASAQEAADASDNEIVVTAQRRAERFQDVPITMTALDSEQLERNNAQTLADIGKLAPAVRIDYLGPFAQPTVRGVGSAFVSAGTGSNIGIYVDGFYAPIALGADFELLNVESIQVLKGPQGTLFGRNTTGGAVLVTTRAPSEELQAVMQASYGKYDTRRLQAYASGGLAEGFAVDVAALYTKSDGYLRNITTGSKTEGGYENWSVRVGAKADLSDRVSFLFRYTHADTDDPAGVSTNAYEVDGQPQALAAIIPGAVIATAPKEVAGLLGGTSRLKTDSFQLTGNFDLGFASLTSYTQYRKDSAHNGQDLDFSSIPLFDVAYASTDKVFTQEFLLTSNPGGPLQWTAGVFYLDWKNDFPETVGSIQGSPWILVNRSYARTQAQAVFADVTYEVADRLFLTAGARYSRNVVKDGRFEGGPGSGNIVFYNYPKLTNNRVTPRAVIRYELNDASSIFASYTAGFKAGLINMSGPPDRTIKPEKINAFEVGYKYATRRLSFDVSAYYYDYKDLQSAINDRGNNVYTNAANSEIYGLEGQVRYQLSPQFELSAGAAYLDAQYKSYPSAVAFEQCLDPSCGAGFGSFLQVTVDASGFRMIRSPKFTGNLNLNYSTEFAGGELGLAANLHYTSKFYFDTSEQFAQKGYTLLGLRAEWTDPSDHYTLAVYADNVLDEKYRRQNQMNGLGIGAVWAPPFTAGASIRAKF